MIVWGTVSACTGAVQNYAGLLVCRFFLGFVEAPYFVGSSVPLIQHTLTFDSLAVYFIYQFGTPEKS